MAALNKNFTKWLIIISVIIGLVLIIRISIWLSPFIFLLLAGLWIYSKISKISFGKKKKGQTKSRQSNYENINDIPNNEGYKDPVEFDKEKVIDVDFVEEKKKN